MRRSQFLGGSEELTSISTCFWYHKQLYEGILLQPICQRRRLTFVLERVTHSCCVHQRAWPVQILLASLEGTIPAQKERLVPPLNGRLRALQFSKQRLRLDLGDMRVPLKLNVLRRDFCRFQLFLFLYPGSMHVYGCLKILPLTVEWGRHLNCQLRCSVTSAPIEGPSRVVLYPDNVSTAIVDDIVLDTHLRSAIDIPSVHAYIKIFF